MESHSWEWLGLYLGVRRIGYQPLGPEPFLSEVLGRAKKAIWGQTALDRVASP